MKCCVFENDSRVGHEDSQLYICAGRWDAVCSVKKKNQSGDDEQYIQ